MKRKRTTQLDGLPKKKRKQGHHLSIEERTTIKVLRSKKMKVKDIADLIMCSEDAVYKLLRKMDVANLKGQGRKRITTKTEDRRIIEVAKKNRRVGTAKLVPHLKQKYGVEVSTSTFLRRIKEVGGFWGHQQTKHIMTENDIITRKKYAKINCLKNWMKKDCHHDESYINLDPNHRRSRHFPNDEIGNRKKHWRNLKFECYCTSEWKSELIFWTGTRTKETWVRDFKIAYEKLKLRHRAVRQKKITFHFDKAPSHKAKYSINEYRKIGVRYKMFCNKPVEINVCKRIWWRIKKFAWGRNPKTLNEFKQLLVEEYGRITQKDLREYFTIPRRIKEVKKCNGGKTHYWTHEPKTNVS